MTWAMFSALTTNMIIVGMNLYLWRNLLTPTKWFRGLALFYACSKLLQALAAAQGSLPASVIGSLFVTTFFFQDLALLFFGFREKKRVVFSILFFSGWLAGIPAMLISFLSVLLLPGTVWLDAMSFASPRYLLQFAFGWVLSLVWMVALVRWLRQNKIQIAVPAFLCALLIAFDGITAFSHFFNEKNEPPISWGYTMVWVAVAYFFIFWLLTSRLRTLSLEKKFLEQSANLQHASYSMALERHEDLRTLRHSILNDIGAAISLLELNNSALAIEHLNATIAKLQATRTPTYCDNRLLDALLANKQHAAKAADVTLLAQCTVPEQCAIRAADLTGLFSYLLDAAIAHSAKGDAVSLTAGMRAGCLFVTVKNPLHGSPPPSLPHDHSTCAQYLKLLTSLYDGDFTRTVENHQLVNAIMLKLPENGSAPLSHDAEESKNAAI